jgi:fructose-specific component phosphotransferase system IIB-like protein
MDLIVGKVLTDLGAYAVRKLIGALVRRVWGPIVTAETRLKLLKDALARKEGRAAGKLTAEEMTTYLVGIVGEHPELRRLMAARVLSEQRLTSATLEALGEWERTSGSRVVWKSEAELVKRTGDPKNLMTLQGKELWINEQAKALKVAKRFHSEVVHELAADSLGIRGAVLVVASPLACEFEESFPFAFNSSQEPDHFVFRQNLL